MASRAKLAKKDNTEDHRQIYCKLSPVGLTQRLKALPRFGKVACLAFGRILLNFFYVFFTKKIFHKPITWKSKHVTTSCIFTYCSWVIRIRTYMGKLVNMEAYHWTILEGRLARIQKLYCRAFVLRSL